MTLPNHPYLRRKRLTMEGCRGLKVDGEGNLLIPMFRDGNLVSVQRISADGEKKFATGAPSKGAVFWISRPRATVTMLCEGFATGATIFCALQTSRVCVCFSAANLIHVSEREEWHGLIAVAADNDEDTRERTGKNPGIEAAEKAAQSIGCGVAIPYCENGTDFNDLFIERLTKFEEQEEFAHRKTHPIKLRERALVPIRAEIMRVARMVGK